MDTVITYYTGKKQNVNPEYPPKNQEQLNRFLAANSAALCFIKNNNFWMKHTKEGNFKPVCRTLYLLSLGEWLDISLNDKF